jgi:hypothetical protein
MTTTVGAKSQSPGYDWPVIVGNPLLVTAPDAQSLPMNVDEVCNGANALIQL